MGLERPEDAIRTYEIALSIWPNLSPPVWLPSTGPEVCRSGQRHPVTRRIPRASEFAIVSSILFVGVYPFPRVGKDLCLLRAMRIAEDIESSRLLVEDNGELGGLENLDGNFG